MEGDDDVVSDSPLGEFLVRIGSLAGGWDAHHA